MTDDRRTIRVAVPRWVSRFWCSSAREFIQLWLIVAATIVAAMALIFFILWLATVYLFGFFVLMGVFIITVITLVVWSD